MIYPLLLLSIWPQNDASQGARITQLLAPKVTVSQPISHLRDYFDARSLVPGVPIFLSAPAVTPQFDAVKEFALLPSILKPRTLSPASAKVAESKPAVPRPGAAKLIATKRPPEKKSVVAARTPEVKPAVTPLVVTKLVRPKTVIEIPANSPIATGLSAATEVALADPKAGNIPSDVPKTVVMAESVSRVLPTAETDATQNQGNFSVAKAVHAAKAIASGNSANAVTPGVTPGTKVEDVPVSLNMVKAPFRALLDQLMRQTGADILLLADSAPDITIKVTKHRFIDTLSDMCVLANLSYLKVNNEYVVGADDKLKSAYPVAYALAHPAPVKAQAPEIVTVTYNTNYCDAQKLADTLAKEFKPDELTMLVAPSVAQTSLGTSDTSSSTGVQAAVMDNKDAKNSRILLLRGPKETVDTAVSLLKAMDVRPPQVNISVTINDMSMDAEKNLGLQWQLPQLTLNQQQGSGFGTFSVAPLSFNATMNALQTQGLDKLLASPNITVQDGQRAYILVGQRLEFPVVSSYNQNGTPIFNVDEERVGIYLQVSVWISNDGKVKLDLYPQVSTVTSFINVNGGSYPQISTREAQTSLTVESGHTIIIGGLIHDEDVANFQQVPWLSKIPILGELFKNSNKTHTKDEVIITITPTIDPK
ncbi:MAG TPA: hypothetical protein VGL56_01735 [Fimbriimonadaceae bacterium]|jgi:type II secretory pathway component GspD/PulD (secretin)